MNKLFRFHTLSTGCLFLASLNSAFALDINITRTISYVDTLHNGTAVRIQRVQDETHSLEGEFSKTSRKCPPFCIQPEQVARGVETVAELELLQFIQDKVVRGTGLLIDTRTQSWYKQGTIPASINIPATAFTATTADSTEDSINNATLTRLGVQIRSSESETSIMDFLSESISDIFGSDNIDNEIKRKLNFDDAKDIMLWCNGMWSDQSAEAILGLIQIGYPADKIYYYRGGMQAWLSAGLTVVK